MRYLFFYLLIFLSSAAVADASPQDALRLARSGAPQLALSMAQQAQNAKPERILWLEWETVQWDVLHQLKRWPELLERSGKVPPDAGDAMRRQALWWNVQASAALHHDAEARDGLVRLLWQVGLDAAQVRKARQLVIETMFSQGRAEEAYLAVLRYQQDFSPLSRDEAAVFARGLAANGKAVQALSLLPLPGEGPLALLLSLQADKVDASAAIAQARAALEKGGGEGYWEVLAQAAPMLRDTATHAQALERLLALQDETSHARAKTTPAELWRSYSAYAMELGNRHQLLQGDDGAWNALALRLEAENPLAARALYGLLARQARNELQRDKAEIRLAMQLLRAGLSGTAHRLFSSTDDLTAALADELDETENPTVRREALLQIAGLSTMRGEYAQAAEYALLSAGEEKDDMARVARFRAAENLALAGYGGDARNQYRLLLESESDPARRQALQIVLGERQ